MRFPRQSQLEWRNALRAEMLARRSALSPQECAGLSERIVTHLIAEVQPDPNWVLGFFWPIRNEPDVRTAVMHWQKSGMSATLPVVGAADEALRFRAWTPETPMVLDVHGIPTPGAGEWLTPDILLLPLNAFDSKGHRLGYGGGYFDRTLAMLAPRPLCIGVGFEINRVDSIRPEPHDQRLDWVVTESGIFRINPATD